MQLRWFTCSLLILTVAACGSSDQDLAQTDSVSSGDQSQEVEPPKPVKNGELNIVNQQQMPTKSDAFEIEKAKIAGDQLLLSVAYGGGCENHIFAAYSTGQPYGGPPANIDIFISHNANNDPCEAYLSKELEIDLSPLKKAYFAANPAAETGTLNINIKSHKVKVVYNFEAVGGEAASADR